VEDVSDVDASLHQLGVRRLDVVDDQQQALQAVRAGRREMDRGR
jgi:hypothetical protein